MGRGRDGDRTSQDVCEVSEQKRMILYTEHDFQVPTRHRPSPTPSVSLLEALLIT